MKKKTNIDTWLIHDRLHSPDYTFATIQAHELWRDVDITQEIDPLCTICTIMSISAHARGKIRESRIQKPKDEIQVNTVSNLEPMKLSTSTRLNYFLILYNSFSRTFCICSIREKITDTCIHDIDPIISSIPCTNKQSRSVQCIHGDARPDTFRK